MVMSFSDSISCYFIGFYGVVDVFIIKWVDYVIGIIYEQ